jgi:hypothetical protein
MYKILKITVHWEKASNPSLTGEYNGCQTAIQRWEEGAGMKRCNWREEREILAAVLRGRNIGQITRKRSRKSGYYSNGLLTVLRMY